MVLCLPGLSLVVYGLPFRSSKSGRSWFDCLFRVIAVLRMMVIVSFRGKGTYVSLVEEMERVVGVCSAFLTTAPWLRGTSTDLLVESCLVIRTYRSTSTALVDDGQWGDRWAVDHTPSPSYQLTVSYAPVPSTKCPSGLQARLEVAAVFLVCSTWMNSSIHP